MKPSLQKKIIVIGCGPKALAIAAKARVLSELGWETPEIVIIEKYEVGANWAGNHGYTDGKCILGISPLKDIGYPYESSFGREVDAKMEAYSYISHLKDEGRFTAWTDGETLAIRHTDFARYLKWLAKKLRIVPVIGTVEHIDPVENSWSISYKTASGMARITADAVIVTGPGPVKQTVDSPVHAQIYDAKNFWQRTQEFHALRGERIALVGGGTSSGSIFERLMHLIGNDSHVDWHTRRGLFTRSENFTNNQIFSYPKNWENLLPEYRLQFVQHTDGGSIEGSTNVAMTQHHEQFTTVYGEPEKIEEKNGKLTLKYSTSHGDAEKEYDRVILATGFESMSFLEWLPDEYRANHDLNTGELPLASRLGTDLSVSDLPGKLHLPMLSWHNYGIGLRNLSCLSTLSDMLLAPYVAQ